MSGSKKKASKRPANKYLGVSSSAHYRRLCIDALKDFLGPVVAVVAGILLSNDDLTRKAIRECAQRKLRQGLNLSKEDREVLHNLTFEVIDSALVLMINHGLVIQKTSNMVTLGATSFAQTGTYSFSLQNGLLILYHGEALSIAMKKYDDATSVLIEDLLLHGSATKDELIKSVALRVVLRRDLAHQCFEKILKKQKPTTENPDKLSTEELLNLPDAKAVRRFCGETFEMLCADKVIIPRKPLYESFNPYDEEAEFGSEEEAVVETGGNKGKKRKDPGDNEEKSVLSYPVMYRLNWGYFLEFFRAKLVRQVFVKSAKSPDRELYGHIIDYICQESIKSKLTYMNIDQNDVDFFEITRETPSISSKKMLKYLTENRLFPESLNDASSRRTKLRQCLRAMEKLHQNRVEYKDPFFSVSNDENVKIELERCLLYIKTRCVMNHIEDEFGIEGRRIVTSLLLHGGLEENTIAEYSMNPQKLARSQINYLRKRGFIDMEEMSKKSDFHPGSTLFVYRAYPLKMIMNAAELCARCLLNARIRYRSFAASKEHVVVKVNSYAADEPIPEDVQESFDEYRNYMDSLDQHMYGLHHSLLVLDGLKLQVPLQDD